LIYDKENLDCAERKAVILNKPKLDFTEREGGSDI
jgi:hypothetical protein